MTRIVFVFILVFGGLMPVASRDVLGGREIYGIIFNNYNVLILNRYIATNKYLCQPIFCLTKILIFQEKMKKMTHTYILLATIWDMTLKKNIMMRMKIDVN